MSPRSAHGKASCNGCVKKPRQPESSWNGSGIATPFTPFAIDHIAHACLLYLVSSIASPDKNADNRRDESGPSIPPDHVIDHAAQHADDAGFLCGMQASACRSRVLTDTSVRICRQARSSCDRMQKSPGENRLVRYLCAGSQNDDRHSPASLRPILFRKCLCSCAAPAVGADCDWCSRPDARSRTRSTGVYPALFLPALTQRFARPASPCGRR